MLDENDDVKFSVIDVNLEGFGSIPSNCINAFDCGDSFLNRFFKKNMEKQLEQSDVHLLLMLERSTGKVVGFLSWTINVLSRELVSDALGRKVQSIPNTVSVFKISMVGIDTQYQKLGLGAALVQEAFWDFVDIHKLVGVTKGVVVDALKGKESFYAKLGFSTIQCDPNSKTTMMFLPINELVSNIDSGSDDAVAMK